MENTGDMEEFTFGGIQNKPSSSSKGCESLEGWTIEKQISYYGIEDSREIGGIDPFYSDFGLLQDDSMEEEILVSKYQQQEEQEQSFSGYGLLDEAWFDFASPPIQTGLQEITKFGGISNGIEAVEPKKENKHLFSLASLELLNSYARRFKRLNWERRIEPSYATTTCRKIANRNLSTEETMRVAGEMFIRSSHLTLDGFSTLSHPFDLSFIGLSDEDAEVVELAKLLLDSAEKIEHQQYDRASILLNQCDKMSSKTGNPVQQIVYYFSEALREKIDRESGRTTSKSLGKDQAFDIGEALMCVNTSLLAQLQKSPFNQVLQFLGIQAIVENVVKAKKVHIIDLQIICGLQWIDFMEALASQDECLLEFLKIIAIATTSNHTIEDTGKRLMSFANSIGLPFSFKIVMVSDMLDLKEDIFELDDEETVAIYAHYFLTSMLVTPNRLENMMRVIRNINPCVMVVIKTEANYNSPAFVNCFIEVLFFHSAYFDCLEDCMRWDDEHRIIIESVFFRESIQNIIVEEGERRKDCSVKVDFWRAFFAHYGCGEAELSRSSLYQAEVVLKKISSWSSGTLDMNGKSLIIGWKGTPIHSLFVWKFL